MRREQLAWMQVCMKERESALWRERERKGGEIERGTLNKREYIRKRQTERGARWGGGGNAPYVRMRAPAVISGDF